MSEVTEKTPTQSGIKKTSDGGAYIPSSKRADGSTRKEIRVRPGYVPPEDVERYKNRTAEAFKTKDMGGVPGAGSLGTANGAADTKSKNAKRREAARKKNQEQANDVEDELADSMAKQGLDNEDKLKQDWRDPSKLATSSSNDGTEELERQKKIRNHLKKLKAVRELKDKKAAGEKLSHDQLMKLGKEPELIRDLQKLNYNGAELDRGSSQADINGSDIPEKVD